MPTTRLCMLALLLGLGTAGLAACDNADGPAEQAGEKVDNATQDAGQALQDAGQALENTGDKLQKQVE